MTCRPPDQSESNTPRHTPATFGGRNIWRSLEELAGDEAFQRLVEREFPSQAMLWPDSVGRRKFLMLMGASLALGGIGGCSVRPAPSEDLVPYVRPPEHIVPGKPLFYATTLTIGGDAVGLLVESHMGRPTKIEGNPQHPASLGGTSALQQASVLSLYDPDRSQTVTYLGRERTWEGAIAALRGALAIERERQGSGLRILTETVASPTLAKQLAELLDQYPGARWYSHEPVDRQDALRGAQAAFGEPLAARYDLQAADVILSLDGDFLFTGPGHLRHAREFAARRRVGSADASTATMNRMYVVETAVTCTGAKADHRLAVRGAEIEEVARAVAGLLGMDVKGQPPSEHAQWLAAAAEDLAAHRGRSLVIAGDRQPPRVHMLAHLMNDHLGNSGQTVSYYQNPLTHPRISPGSLPELSDEMERGEVELLVILGGNPVQTASADVPFGKGLERVPLRMHWSLYQDETSRHCQWHLPATHDLEAWSDAVAFDGTASIVQPLIEPLYQGRSAHEIVALISQSPSTAGRDIVRRHWREQWQPTNPQQDFEQLWETALHDGVIVNSQSAAKRATVVADWQDQLKADRTGYEATGLRPSGDQDLELVFLPDPTIYDGRFANNGWLQELPKPVTQLTWGNAAIMSPATAQRLGLEQGSYAHGGEHGGYHMSVVELRLHGRTVQAPYWVMPGHADGTVTVYLGGGRKFAGRVGGTPDETVGFNSYLLRTRDQPWFAAGLTVTPTAERQLVTCTQQHHSMDSRDVVRSATLEEFRQVPDFAAAAQRREQQDQALGSTGPLNFYQPFDYAPPKHKWGMAIDLTSCIGCNACIAACQAENNIPVVGKEQVAAGREMHWLRVDRYVAGSADKPEGFHFQPVPCMHCENAPCEYVCPVEATVHSAEGLNDMVYNRCVGTRFCSNNCPYKVRRFNFLAYADFKTDTLRLQYNPDVTVRSRGVMEKCTYCVQRIRHAEIDAQVERRGIADGEILTACQAACPAEAITFGDMNDPKSRVSRAKASPLDYGLLAHLNTAPRTTYLAELRNPNPRLEKG